MNSNMPRGFTIIELMVTLVVAAILITVGAPSFNNIVKNNRLSGQINNLVASLNLARSESLKRSQPVSLCKSSNGTACSADWSASNDGWAVFVNDNMDSSIDANDEVLRVGERLKGDSTLRYTQNVLTFDSQGSSPGLSGTFVMCDDRGAENAKAVIVLASGLIRQAVDNNGDDIVEDIDGNNVTCP